MDIKERDRKRCFVTLDIVIPVYNEEEVLPLLFRKLKAVFSHENLSRERVKSVHYIFIDDGSQDRTAEMISKEIRNGFFATLLRLSRNFGQQNAVTAGLDVADADVISVIDADLQDPPEVIFRLLDKWRKGADIIHGRRTKRREGFFKTSTYWFFYRILNLLADVKLPVDCGDFCLMDRDAMHALRNLPEKLRFPRHLRAWVGFRQDIVEYARSARAAGQTKYSIRDLFALATNGLASSGTRLLKLSQLFCAFFLLLTLFFTVFALINYICYIDKSETIVWILLLFALISFFAFMQAVLIYILGAYIGRVYLEVKGRPAYILMETVSPQNNDM